MEVVNGGSQMGASDVTKSAVLDELEPVEGGGRILGIHYRCCKVEERADYGFEHV